MKQTLDLPRTAGPDHTGLLPATATRTRRSALVPPADMQISTESSHSVSGGTVWTFVVILLLVTLAAGYLFWAKLTTAWPFAQ